MNQPPASANSSSSRPLQFGVVMLSFFVMGFVDLVGPAANYVQRDLDLSHTMANLIPSLTFVWFALLAIPSGMLMNRIGRRKTVILSQLITLLSLCVPLLGSSLPVMLTAFSLLGIGNAIMQTSLNPLVSNIVVPDRMASTLTFGQFVKAIASFVSPLLIALFALHTPLGTWLGWKGIFLVYALVTALSALLLSRIQVKEHAPDLHASLSSTLRLLGRPFVLLCFLGIIAHAGIDVGINTSSPRVLIARFGIPLEEAALAASVYFMARTLGALLGSALLRKVAVHIFFGISALMLLAGLLLFTFSTNLWLAYGAVALAGFGNANIFSLIFTRAIQRNPAEQNAVSALMIMGILGATILPFFMGLLSDTFGHLASLLLLIAPRLK